MVTCAEVPTPTVPSIVDPGSSVVEAVLAAGMEAVSGEVATPWGCSWSLSPSHEAAACLRASASAAWVAEAVAAVAVSEAAETGVAAGSAEAVAEASAAGAAGPTPARLVPAARSAAGFPMGSVRIAEVEAGTDHWCPTAGSAAADSAAAGSAALVPMDSAAVPVPRGSAAVPVPRGSGSGSGSGSALAALVATDSAVVEAADFPMAAALAEEEAAEDFPMAGRRPMVAVLVVLVVDCLCLLGFPRTPKTIRLDYRLDYCLDYHLELAGRRRRRCRCRCRSRCRSMAIARRLQQR
jgi:hypothetical protein